MNKRIIIIIIMIIIIILRRCDLIFCMRTLERSAEIYKRRRAGGEGVAGEGRGDWLRGGRLVVVAFHSLEDRIVKRFMTEASGRSPAPSRHDPRGLLTRTTPDFRLLAAKALRPTSAETSANPRARSARMRALERLPVPVESRRVP